MADARAIVLPVEVNLDQATGQLRALKQVVSTEAAQSAAILERSLAATERQTTAAARSAVTWQDALRGANPAISGVTQALRVMGAEATPAVTGISHALVSMVAGGFTPLAAILAGATGIVALMSSFTTSTNDAAKSVSALTSEIERLAELQRQTGPLSLGMRGAQSGRTSDQQAFIEELNSARARLEQIDARRGDLQWRLDAAQASEQAARAAGDRHSEAAVESLALSRQLEQVTREYELARAKVREMERILQIQQQTSAAQRPAATIPQDFAGFGDLRATLPTDAERLQDEERVRQERYRQGQKEAEAYAAGFFDQQERENEDRLRFVMGREPAAPTGDRVAGYTATNPQRVRTYADELDRQFQASAESGLISGIQAALTDPSNWRGALESFARSLQAAVTQRMAQGIADALLGHGEMFGSGGLFGLFRGATASTGETMVPGAAPTDTYNAEGLIEPVSGPAKMSTRAQPIAVVNVWDESTADAVAAKMSAGGARVVMARAMGGGVSAGTVPGRRGR